MRKLLFSALLMLAAATLSAQQATMRLDAQKKHQKITGFGAFVCSPQFTYNHMSNAEIDKVWGTPIGCNIMRLYIPIGRNTWGQSLATAKYAKQKGLIVFASPWGQPAEWKTNNSSNAKNEQGVEGKLKRENWADYAQYLEDYVQYLRQNGVELDAISIQNEPDWPCSYAGCIWEPAEMAEFVKLYGRTISCKIIAPETLAVSDSYANALNTTDVLGAFDIYGGHQYGGIQSGYKQLGQKGKEVWMTEYLINWNENKETTRNFDFSQDFFDFFEAINVCMLGDFNAWIHYAGKRYYGPLGDGTCGTENGAVTKRGYIMAHFARFVTGFNRIDANITGSGLQGSAYLSQGGDTVVAVIANTSKTAVELTLDLPFYTTSGILMQTTKDKNFSGVAQKPAETCRPVVTLSAECVATARFVRSRERQASTMRGVAVHFDKIEEQSITNNAFGTGYKLTGATKTFDHSNPLISAKTDNSSGYVKLNSRFSKLVMMVKSASSSLNYTSSKTTLYYINGKGQVASHDYGTVDFGQRENFQLEFDLSPATLTDGCQGLIAITNDNWSSKLTINFGDVYLSDGGTYAAKIIGPYVADDSFVLQYGQDQACVSIDMTGVTEWPESLPWLGGSNKVVFAPETAATTNANLVKGTTCAELLLSDQGGDFRPNKSFTATKASYTATVSGMQMMVLPFSASLPTGVQAYSVGDDLTLTAISQITAHQPFILAAEGKVVLTGEGSVAYQTAAANARFCGTYKTVPLYAGDYVFGQQGGQWGFVRQASNTTLAPFGVYARLTATDAFVPVQVPSAINGVKAASMINQPVYNMMGQHVSESHRGLVIRNGRKYLKK